MPIKQTNAVNNDSLILVVSNIAIEAAPALVDLFPAGAASLITGSDFYKLSSGISVTDFPSSSLRLRDNDVAVTDIKGVISTIPSFLPAEFYFVTPEDRLYVCAETNAFFQYFLSELSCVKCNAPDWRMFVAGNVHKLEWINAAVRAEIPLAAFHFKNGYPRSSGKICDTTKCTIIFDEIIQRDCPKEVQEYTTKMAAALGLSYLECIFITEEQTNKLVHISAIPDISATENREAIANHFKKFVS